MKTSKSGWWYLSFGDPKSGKWLGGCVVHGKTIVDAIGSAYELGINPGGEVVGFPIDARLYARLPRNRLLNLTDFADLGPAIRGKTIH